MVVSQQCVAIWRRSRPAAAYPRRRLRHAHTDRAKKALIVRPIGLNTALQTATRMGGKLTSTNTKTASEIKYKCIQRAGG